MRSLNAMFSRAFAELTSDRTAIFISHRFSTVRMADHILVLQQGDLVEQGSHEQLMVRGRPVRADVQYASEAVSVMGLLTIW